MQKAAQKEARTESILLSLSKLAFLTRSQLQLLHDLGSARNAQRVMKDLERYVNTFRDGETVFYLNQAGRERIGCKKKRVRTNQTRHFIMRNDIYIAYSCPSDWRTEIRLGVKGHVSLVCDALFKQDGKFHIVEIDYMQKMQANRAKIEKYRQLLQLNVFDRSPRFVWMTTTEYRRQELVKLSKGLDVIIFALGDFH